MEKTLITKDMASLVQDAVNEGCDVSGYVFSSWDRFRVGKVVVVRTVADGGVPNVTLYLDDDADGRYFKAWNDDVGRVLVIELKKREPALFEIRTDMFTALVREIPSESVESFLTRGMVHLKMADKVYTVIKVVKRGDDYLSMERCIDCDIESADSAETTDENVSDNAPDEPVCYELF